MNRQRIAMIVLGLAAALAAGCNGGPDVTSKGEGTAALKQEIPSPINLLLPHTIRVHPFTGTRAFSESGGVTGIDVRIEARDAYGDPTKAFGDFRFELYSWSGMAADPKGQRIASWRVPLVDPKENLVHWDNLSKRYQFKLQWYQPIPVGEKFIIVATFDSPWTERLSGQREFIAGE